MALPPKPPFPGRAPVVPRTSLADTPARASTARLQGDLGRILPLREGAAREFVFSTADFERVRKLIHQYAGISLSPVKKDMVYSRLARRLRALGKTNFSEYLDLLTPGDFAAVVRQYQLLADEIDPQEFVEQLEREHRAKPDVRFSRSIGFRAAS